MYNIHYESSDLQSLAKVSQEPFSLICTILHNVISCYKWNTFLISLETSFFKKKLVFFFFCLFMAFKIFSSCNGFFFGKNMKCLSREIYFHCNIWMKKFSLCASCASLALDFCNDFESILLSFGKVLQSWNLISLWDLQLWICFKHFCYYTWHIKNERSLNCLLVCWKWNRDILAIY